MKAALIDHYDCIEQKGIHLETAIEEEVYAHIAPQEMRRVFDNLIVNAINHNEKGIKLRATLHEINDAWFFSVADTGVPILAEDRERLFEPFAKADAARSGGGSGLGLANVKRIVACHQGSVKLTGGIDGYTKAFVVEIPK